LLPINPGNALLAKFFFLKGVMVYENTMKDVSHARPVVSDADGST
jgi:hypothetical protein